MSMATNLANDAFINDNFELATELYTQAIAMDSTQRICSSTAPRPTSSSEISPMLLLMQAERELDSSMAKAYFRKGVACLKLEEYQTAKIALQAGASLAPEDARFTKLFKECDEGLEGS